MILHVDESSPVPVFEQLRSQLAEMIGSGALPAEHRLPPIRQLAADLGLAPGTVARVYKELETDGLVRSRVRHGTTVAAGMAKRPADTRADLRAAARAYAAAAARLGVGEDTALRAVSDAWSTATS